MQHTTDSSFAYKNEFVLQYQKWLGGYQSKVLKLKICKSKNTVRKWNLLLLLTFIKPLLNINNLIDKYWHNWSINEYLWKVFEERPFVAYRRNTNFHQLIGGIRILKNKVVHKNTKQPKQAGHCSPCLLRLSNFCCKQVKKIKTSRRYRTKETFPIFHNLTYKILNNHRKDAKLQVSALRCQHFNEQNNNFQQDAKFILIEQIKKQATPDEARTISKWGETLWASKLKKSYPDGLNQELNNINWWWWRWWIVFVIWLTDERHLALFPAETIIRDPHHQNLTISNTPLNLCRTWVQAVLFPLI